MSRVSDILAYLHSPFGDDTHNKHSGLQLILWCVEEATLYAGSLLDTVRGGHERAR
ncbi:MAG: hypothetical protein H6974_16170 [Gammaproteobacteria bacterium]|nr:hypothetical protein [Gammaproteobacteria bacterium]